MRIIVDVDATDVVDEFLTDASHQEALEFIKDMDLQIADQDFTLRLINELWISVRDGMNDDEQSNFIKGMVLS